MQHNMGFAPDAIFVTGFAYANPAPTLPAVGTRTLVKTSLCSKKWLQLMDVGISIPLERSHAELHCGKRSLQTNNEEKN